MNIAKNKSRVKWTSIVICLGIVIIGIYILLPKGNVIYKSENITVKSFDYSRENVPPTEIGSVYLTEEEIFNNYNTAIFKGTVKDIENIKIDFDGDVVYRSIVTISIQEIYRGDLQTGEEIKILFPLPIDEEKYTMEGIFMPLILDNESAMWQENDIWFDKREIVDYGLFDVERFAFLETEDGLVFDEWVYESINDAETLDDIEEYILTMID